MIRRHVYKVMEYVSFKLRSGEWVARVDYENSQPNTGAPVLRIYSLGCAVASARNLKMQQPQESRVEGPF